MIAAFWLSFFFVAFLERGIIPTSPFSYCVILFAETLPITLLTIFIALLVRNPYVGVAIMMIIHTIGIQNVLQERGYSFAKAEFHWFIFFILMTGLSWALYWLIKKVQCLGRYSTM